MTDVRALVLGCTLEKSPSRSSSELIGRRVLDRLVEHGATGDYLRVVDHHVAFGVTIDQGEGDMWPAIRQKIMDADILVLALPIWLGQPSSVAKMVLERLDAEISETDDEGRMLTYGKIAGVAVVGNEDGAHHSIAECFGALSEVGFTIPASASTYWVGEAMQGVDYQDRDPEPEETAGTNDTLARQLVHLARLLKASTYPPQG